MGTSRMDRLEKKVDILVEVVTKGFTKVEYQINELKKDNKEVHKRLDAVDKRLDKIETRLQSMENTPTMRKELVKK